MRRGRIDVRLDLDARRAQPIDHQAILVGQDVALGDRDERRRQSAQVRPERSYVLQVWFDQGGRRLMSQVVLEGQEAKIAGPSTIPVTQPASRPTTAPSISPGTAQPK